MGETFDVHGKGEAGESPNVGGKLPECDVAWTADQVDEGFARGATVVVIDVLRATTMIAALLAAGARSVWPAAELDEARALARRLGPGTLLAGERGGLPPEGFDLGNAPSEVTPERVAGKQIVLTTTNGTRAIRRAQDASKLMTGAFVNADAVVRALLDDPPERLYIACAGTEGRFSLDDALCAGMILERFLRGLGESPSTMASDAATAAVGLYLQYRDRLEAYVRGSRHGRRLTALGLARDIDYAVSVDRHDFVPVRNFVSGETGSSVLARGTVLEKGV